MLITGSIASAICACASSRAGTQDDRETTDATVRTPRREEQGQPGDASALKLDAAIVSRLPEAGVPPPFGTQVADPRYEDPFFWLAPIALDENVGWKESTEPLCIEEGNVTNHSLWSDGHSVYLLVTMQPRQVNGLEFQGGGTRVYYHDGTGWQTFLDELRGDDESAPPLWDDDADWRLTGFAEEGPLRYGAFDDCGLQSLVRGVPDCLIDSPIVATTGGTDPYAVGEEGLFEREDGSWNSIDTELAIDGGMRAIWAGDGTVVVVGDHQQAMMRSAGQQDFAWLTNVPAGDYRSVWGFSSDDIWATTSTGQLVHYDGSSWRVELSEFMCHPSSDDGVPQLLGDESGALYIRTEYRLLKYADGSLVTLVELDCIGGKQLGSMWLNSPSELFLTIIDNAQSSRPCGESFVLYFDGQELHRM